MPLSCVRFSWDPTLFLVGLPYVSLSLFGTLTDLVSPTVTEPVPLLNRGLIVDETREVSFGTFLV